MAAVYLHDNKWKGVATRMYTSFKILHNDFQFNVVRSELKHSWVIFTFKKSGTSTLSHCGSQCAKHFVDSSFWGTNAGSSCSCKLVTSGRRDLCSGRKKRFTCSSVLKAFTNTMARERVTRKLNAFMLWLQDRHETLDEVPASTQAFVDWK